jgi:hypothetical protein
VRDEDKEVTQQHLVKFRHFDDLLNPQKNAVELLLFNIHDKNKSFAMQLDFHCILMGKNKL